MNDIVKRLRAEDPECGLRHSLAMEAADCIEELENDLNLLRRQNREQRYEIERLKVPENERYPLGLAPVYVEKKDG